MIVWGNENCIWRDYGFVYGVAGSRLGGVFVPLAEWVRGGGKGLSGCVAFRVV